LKNLLFQKASEVKRKLRDLLKPSITLLLICVIVAAALSLTYSVTAEKIEERAQIDADAARKYVFENADSFSKLNDRNEIIKEAYKAIKNDKPVGYVFTAASKGYGGNIMITVGVDQQKKVTGVKIGENKETPGLGSKTNNKSFLSQFTDFVAGEPLKVVKSGKSKSEDIEAVSGATISSKAVTRAVQAALDMSAELAKKEVN
jgi:electron transport complex protein RnfG